jgi:hypothetical protein
MIRRSKGDNANPALGREPPPSRRRTGFLAYADTYRVEDSD